MQARKRAQAVILLLLWITLRANPYLTPRTTPTLLKVSWVMETSSRMTLKKRARSVRMRRMSLDTTCGEREGRVGVYRAGVFDHGE